MAVEYIGLDAEKNLVVLGQIFTMTNYEAPLLGLRDSVDGPLSTASTRKVPV